MTLHPPPHASTKVLKSNRYVPRIWYGMYTVGVKRYGPGGKQKSDVPFLFVLCYFLRLGRCIGLDHAPLAIGSLVAGTRRQKTLIKLAFIKMFCVSLFTLFVCCGYAVLATLPLVCPSHRGRAVKANTYQPLTTPYRYGLVEDTRSLTLYLPKVPDTTLLTIILIVL